jgi:hypothetical protein
MMNHYKDEKLLEQVRAKRQRNKNDGCLNAYMSFGCSIKWFRLQQHSLKISLLKISEPCDIQKQ